MINFMLAIAAVLTLIAYTLFAVTMLEKLERHGITLRPRKEVRKDD